MLTEPNTKNIIKDKCEKWSFKKSSNFNSSNTTLIGNSVSNIYKQKKSQPSEVSINLKEILEMNLHSKNEIKFAKPFKSEYTLFEDKRQFDIKNNLAPNSQVFREEKQYATEITEDVFIKSLNDYSLDDNINNKDKEYSDSGRISTKKSEVSEKNEIFKNERFFDKVMKQDIMFTNEISFDSADEKFKKILFKKN